MIKRSMVLSALSLALMGSGTLYSPSWAKTIKLPSRNIRRFTGRPAVTVAAMKRAAKKRSNLRKRSKK